MKHIDIEKNRREFLERNKILKETGQAYVEDEQINKIFDEMSAIRDIVMGYKLKG